MPVEYCADLTDRAAPDGDCMSCCRYDRISIEMTEQADTVSQLSSPRLRAITACASVIYTVEYRVAVGYSELLRKKTPASEGQSGGRLQRHSTI